MSADFWASYASGAIGICIGNRLDIVKTELQAGNRLFISPALAAHETTYRRFTNLFRGAAAPILGYGALNSILFVTYNRSLKLMEPTIFDPTKLAGVGLDKIWIAGAIGGLACWVVSAPSELIKCRTQLQVDGKLSSYATAINVFTKEGIRGLYLGGTITSIRDSFGYAWYFWSYELSKRILLSRQPDPFQEPKATDVLIAGGIAGVVTWASVFPLDVVKTRMQTQERTVDEAVAPLLAGKQTAAGKTTSWHIIKNIARNEGLFGFYRGLGVCSLRAFIVNAAQVCIVPGSIHRLTHAVVPLRRSNETIVSCP